jgi:UDP:flavonoid glycosyltransferase YjiC (YdhE family)
MSRRQRILFFAEAVTLAHVSRPLVLASGLDPERYEVHFACADGYDLFLKDTGFTRWSIDTIPAEQFLNALASGSRLYDYETLSHYLEDDLRIIDAVSPDLVVGDFRLTLAVSAPLRQVPYAAISNAHWSPYALSGFPLPEHPMASILGVKLANVLFQLARPAVFAYHGIPINKLRRRHGLTALGDLRQIYTWGDYSLYADIPSLIPTSEDLPGTHRYIGPILWSPDVALPAWWNEIARGEPLVYVTLGSSGKSDLLPVVVKALEKLPVTAMVATAGRLKLDELPANVYASEFLPGLEAARRADLVICSGGSATAYQALAEGVPVLGIAANMDQYLTMSAIEKNGAGKLLRAGKTDAKKLVGLIDALLQGEEYRRSANRLAKEIQRYDAAQRFNEVVAEITSS